MNEKNGKSNSVMGAAIFGAVVGASAVALMNKQVRKSIKAAILDSLEKSDQKFAEATKKLQSVKSGVVKSTVKNLGKAQQRMEEIAKR